MLLKLAISRSATFQLVVLDGLLSHCGTIRAQDQSRGDSRSFYFIEYSTLETCLSTKLSIYRLSDEYLNCLRRFCSPFQLHANQHILIVGLPSSLLLLRHGSYQQMLLSC
uniref:Secreted protein n=1 Tax=Paramormyrops kingsleyae TaxID=1676925 RepID=A0A3B3RTC9_9TELE